MKLLLFLAILFSLVSAGATSNGVKVGQKVSKQAQDFNIENGKLLKKKEDAAKAYKDAHAAKLQANIKSKNSNGISVKEYSEIEKETTNQLKNSEEFRKQEAVEKSIKTNTEKHETDLKRLKKEREEADKRDQSITYRNLGIAASTVVAAGGGFYLWIKHKKKQAQEAADKKAKEEAGQRAKVRRRKRKT